MKTHRNSPEHTQSSEGSESCYNEVTDTCSLTTEYADFFDTEQAAQFLGISIKTLHNLCSSGQVPYYKFGRRNRYRKDELKALLLAEPRGGRK